MSETVQNKKKSKVAQFFGQFAERQFYAELAELAIKEVIKAAALAFAGTLTYHIQKSFQGNQIDYSHQNNQPNNNNNGSAAANRAFGAQDTTDYRSSYRPAYSPSVVSSNSGGFPGFGAR